MNTKSGENRITKSKPGAYRKKSWSNQSVIFHYDRSARTTSVKFLANCSEVRNASTNFTPKVTQHNTLATQPSEIIRTIGNQVIGDTQTKVMAFFGFIYEFEFINGIVPE
jgi:hypothetical protein